MAVVAHLLGQRSQQFRRRILVLADEEAVQLATEELSTGRLLQRDAHDVCRFPGSGLLEERLGIRVVFALLEGDLAPLNGPAGEGSGCRADVALGVVADAEGKQFEELAAAPKFSFGFSFLLPAPSSQTSMAPSPTIP